LIGFGPTVGGVERGREGGKEGMRKGGGGRRRRSGEERIKM